MTRKTPLFRMTETAVGGDLRSYLAAARAAGDAWGLIARRIYLDHGIEVTDQTLRMWGRQLEIADKPRTQVAS